MIPATKMNYCMNFNSNVNCNYFKRIYLEESELQNSNVAGKNIETLNSVPVLK